MSKSNVPYLVCPFFVIATRKIRHACMAVFDDR